MINGVDICDELQSVVVRGMSMLDKRDSRPGIEIGKSWRGACCGCLANVFVGDQGSDKGGCAYS